MDIDVTVGTPYSKNNPRTIFFCVNAKFISEINLFWASKQIGSFESHTSYFMSLCFVLNFKKCKKFTHLNNKKLQKSQSQAD